MRPRDHVILGTAASAGIYFIWGPVTLQSVICFWFASILIDIDHYLDYIYNNGFTDYSFMRMMKYHNLLFSRRLDPAFVNLSIFHSVETMSVLLIIALYTGSTALIFIWWGFLFHIACDTIKLIKEGISSLRSNSIIGYYFRIKRMKLQGLDTKAIYTRAANEVRGNYAS